MINIYNSKKLQFFQNDYTNYNVLRHTNPI